MDNYLIIRLLLTIVFGAILGLETETRDVEKLGLAQAAKKEKQKIGGLRTYTVIALLGGISGIFYVSGTYVLSYILLLAIILLVIVAYVLNVQLKKAFGITTEVAIVITFIIGFLTTTSIVSVPVILAILVLLTFFLSQKRGLGAFISKIQHKELIDVIKFGLIAIVVLPLLPNENFSILDFAKVLNFDINTNLSFLSQQLFNPFQIWLTVVIISGISLITYTLSKFIGPKASLILSGILGGFISSTSMTVALTHRSKNTKDPQMQVLLAGINILANAFSFVTIMILIFINSSSLLLKIVPFFFISLILGVIIGLVLYALSNKSKEVVKLELSYQPFSLMPALKFVFLILLIRIIVQILFSLNVSSTFLIILTSISGLTGIDASSIAFTGLYNAHQITILLAIIAICSTVFVNIIGKFIYSISFGNKKFAFYTLAGMLIPFIAGIILLALV